MENNKMPGMPQLNKSDDAEALSSSISPVPEDSHDEESSGLEVPDHKPSVESQNNSIVEIKPSKKGIDVVANNKGFYNQHRYKEGDEFSIKDFEALGEWMDCKDPDLQKQHQANIKAKKAKK